MKKETIINPFTGKQTEVLFDTKNSLYHFNQTVNDKFIISKVAYDIICNLEFVEININNIKIEKIKIENSGSNAMIVNSGHDVIPENYTLIQLTKILNPNDYFVSIINAWNDGEKISREELFGRKLTLFYDGKMVIEKLKEKIIDYEKIFFRDSTNFDSIQHTIASVVKFAWELVDYSFKEIGIYKGFSVSTWRIELRKHIDNLDVLNFIANNAKHRGVDESMQKIDIYYFMIVKSISVMEKNFKPGFYAFTNNGIVDIGMVIHKFYEYFSKLYDEYANVTTSLHEAIKNNNISDVKNIIDMNVDVNGMNIDGYTPLHLSIDKSPEITQILIDAGANLNAKSNIDFLTPLQRAVLNRKNIEYSNNVKINIEIMIRYLKSKNREQKFKKIINKKDINHNTLLHYAVLNDDIEIVQILLKNKADVNMKSKGGLTPIFMTCFNSVSSNETTDIAELLLKHDADLNIVEDDGRSPLYLAIQENRADLVECYLENGANPDMRMYSNGYTYTAREFTKNGKNPEISIIMSKY